MSANTEVIKALVTPKVVKLQGAKGPQLWALLACFHWNAHSNTGKQVCGYTAKGPRLRQSKSKAQIKAEAAATLQTQAPAPAQAPKDAQAPVKAP